MRLAAAVLVALVAMPFAEPPPLAEIAAPATAEAPAERIDPPTTTATTIAPDDGWSSDSWAGRCVGMEPLLHRYSPGWDALRMSRIMYRESRCLPTVRSNAGATGLLQLMPMHCRWLPAALGEPCSVARLTDPVYNVRAAAELWARDGYQPWRL